MFEAHHQLQPRIVNFLRQPWPHDSSGNKSSNTGFDRGENSKGGQKSSTSRARRGEDLWRNTNKWRRRVMQFRLIEVKTGFTGTVFHCLSFICRLAGIKKSWIHVRTAIKKTSNVTYANPWMKQFLAGYSILVAKFTFVTILFFFFSPLALRRFIIQSLFDRFFSSFSRRNEILAWPREKIKIIIITTTTIARYLVSVSIEKGDR